MNNRVGKAIDIINEPASFDTQGLTEEEIESIRKLRKKREK